MRAQTNSAGATPARARSRVRAVAYWFAIALGIAFLACGPEGLNPRPDNPGETKGPPMMPMGGQMNPGSAAGAASGSGGVPFTGSAGGGMDVAMGGAPSAAVGGTTGIGAGGGPSTIPGVPDAGVTDAGSRGDADPGDAVIVH